MEDGGQEKMLSPIVRPPSVMAGSLGYQRVSILTALVSAASIIVIAIFVYWDAVQRLNRPAPVGNAPRAMRIIP